MSQRRRGYSLRPLHFLLSLILLLIAPALLFAQSVASTQDESSKPALNSERSSAPATASDSSRADVDERLRALEEELRQQNKSLTEMRALITEQQRVIAALSSKPTASEQITGEQKDLAAVTAAPASQTQTPTLEERVKKVEDKVLAIGPFRLSGDFRLRFDGIFRKADPTPPAGFAPLTHQQNVRMRYRLRLNLDTDVDSKISFHGQLATGPLNNPTGNDQDFGEVTARHIFAINEAWIDYHPNKATQLQAGRVQEIFADNSRFLFDDDVRFNGFNEKYAFSFKNNGVKVTSLELRAGQYIFSNPNVAIVTAGSPLAQAGAIVGSTGRNSNLFHQGFLVNQKFNDSWSDQLGGDVQLYRNPNQIQLASTANGVALIVQNGLGITLSGPLPGTGNGAKWFGHNFIRPSARNRQRDDDLGRRDLHGQEFSDRATHVSAQLGRIPKRRSRLSGGFQHPGGAQCRHWHKGTRRDAGFVADRKDYEARRHGVHLHLFNQRSQRPDLAVNGR